MNEEELSLMKSVKALLKERGDITLAIIHKDLDIQPGWVQKLTAGCIKSPSVNRMQKLYEYLSGKKLVS